MARNRLFVLKVPLNPKQTNKQNICNISGLGGGMHFTECRSVLVISLIEVCLTSCTHSLRVIVHGHM